MDDLQIGGLPLHPLLVHGVVILLPLTALALILGAVWPAARRRLGIVTPLAAVVVLILVPITVQAGEALLALTGPAPGVERHEELGRTLLPWAIALAVVAVAQWLWFRWGAARLGGASRGGAGSGGARRADAVPATAVVPARTGGRGAVLAGSVALGVAAVVVAVGSVVTVILIGDSGARAVWAGLIG